MKKFLLLILIATGLASCSTYNNFIDKLYSSDDSIQVNPDDNLDNPDQEDRQDSSEDKPTASLNMIYKPESHEIEAKIITNWNGAPQGTIYLTWRAPKDTNCYSTSFPITKFKDAQDYTVDNQSVLSDDKVCDGVWTATVVNKSDNSELAKSSLEIK
ncbi:TUL4 family outer member lipoprotein LpnB [Francisella salina]|uniref:17 kDa major membrane protein n=1 Tax=Francisella salina TaxID=573569 RepID=A0ABM5M8G5_FRAST|nr:TUL4 family lipoprotein [Francisella salina]AEI35371.1 17 kDa major membrane protein precursor [Francisella salina]